MPGAASGPMAQAPQPVRRRYFWRRTCAMLVKEFIQLRPFAGMPRWAQWIGEGLPLTHYLRIVRAILLKGATFSELALDAWALAGLMLVAMTIAVTRFRRTLD